MILLFDGVVQQRVETTMLMEYMSTLLPWSPSLHDQYQLHVIAYHGEATKESSVVIFSSII